MKLSECKHGLIVRGSRVTLEGRSVAIGMIVGITENFTGEAIPLVQWQDCLQPCPIHHCHLSVYED